MVALSPEAVMNSAKDKGVDPVEFAGKYYDRTVAREFHPDAIRSQMKAANVAYESAEWNAQLGQAEENFKRFNSDEARADFIGKVSEARTKAETNAQTAASASPVRPAKNRQAASEAEFESMTLRSGNADFERRAAATRDNKYSGASWDNAGANYMRGSRAYGNSRYYDTAFDYTGGDIFGADYFRASAAAYSPTTSVFARIADMNRYTPSSDNLANVLASLEVLQVYSFLQRDDEALAEITKAMGQVELYDKTRLFAAELSEANPDAARMLNDFAEKNNPSKALEAAVEAIQKSHHKASGEIAAEVGAVRDYYNSTIAAAKKNGAQSPNIAAGASHGRVISAVVGASK